MESTQQNTIQNIGVNIPRPSKYQVVLHNDDHTPMEFVIELLKNVYFHDQSQAEQITLSIHNDGRGIAGIYYYEIAEQKVNESLMYSRAAGYPLSFDIEEV
jgi:ATP-dependent Clp protease adaptor protein ClpS